MLRVKGPQDLGAGLLFLFIGFAGIYFGKDLTYGSARGMGPGYFPIWLSCIIGAMGLICLVRSVTLVGEPIGRIPWPPILWVSLGVLMFGFLVEHVKLELALILLTIVCTQSRRTRDAAQTIILAACALFGLVILTTNFAAFAVLKPLGEFILPWVPLMILALFLTVAWLLRGDNHERQTLMLAAGMAIISVIVFVTLLGQAMPAYSSDFFGSIFSKIGALFTGAKGH